MLAEIWPGNLIDNMSLYCYDIINDLNVIWIGHNFVHTPGLRISCILVIVIVVHASDATIITCNLLFRLP